MTLKHDLINTSYVFQFNNLADTQDILCDILKMNILTDQEVVCTEENRYILYRDEPKDDTERPLKDIGDTCFSDCMATGGSDARNTRRVSIIWGKNILAGKAILFHGCQDKRLTKKERLLFDMLKDGSQSCIKPVYRRNEEGKVESDFCETF